MSRPCFLRVSALGLFLLAMSVPLSVRPAPPVTPSQIVRGSFSSKAVQMKRKFQVYLPPGYADRGEKRYPVVYALHGLGGHEGNFFKYADLQVVLDGLIRTKKVRPLIVVAPDGDNGYWVDHTGGGPRWGAYVALELVDVIDQRFATRRDRRGRATVGVSMGGFGALSLVLQYPEVFHAGISLSGALFPAAPTHRKVYGRAWGNPPNERHWARVSPMELMKALVPDSPLLPRLYLQCGDADSLGFYAYAQAASSLLSKKGVPHVFRTRKGGKHQWKTWRPESRHWLKFLEAGWAIERPVQKTEATGGD